MDQSKILVVDQDEANRNFLAQMLQKKNYVVHHAATGAEGIRIAGEGETDLIVFDTNLPDMTAREFIQGLKQNPHVSEIPCVVLSSKSDPEEMQECLDAGCAEYYIKSGMVMVTLVNALPKLLIEGKRIQSEVRKGLLFAFTSAKGGTGTTSLCANIGMSLAQYISQAKVAVVDMVLPFGSIAPLVGCEESDFNLVTVSGKSADQITPAFFRENLCTPQRWLFRLLPGSPDPDVANELNVSNIGSIIEALRQAFDYVLVDVGRSLSRITMPIIEEADLTVLLLSTDLSTVNLTQKFWRYLQSHGTDPHRVFPILNRAVGLEGLTKAEAEKILGLEIKLMMPYMMGNFTLANNQNMPIVLKFPNDTASMVLKQAAVDMTRQALAARARAESAPKD